jgi:N-dimethylarginine dimethylaminohydrolase
MGLSEQATSVPALSAPRCEVVHAWLTKDVYALLEQEAERRRMHPDALLAMIANDLLLNGLVGALLDR